MGCKISLGERSCKEDTGIHNANVLEKWKDNEKEDERILSNRFASHFCVLCTFAAATDRFIRRLCNGKSLQKLFYTQRADCFFS